MIVVCVKSIDQPFLFPGDDDNWAVFNGLIVIQERLPNPKKNPKDENDPITHRAVAAFGVENMLSLMVMPDHLFEKKQVVEATAMPNKAMSMTDFEKAREKFRRV